VGEDDVVAARLRSVLAATNHDVRDQAATAAAPRRILYGGPVAPSRYTTALTDLAEVGEPLDWSDVISSWPDDVDLDPLPEGATPVIAVPEISESDTTGGFRPGTPWASPPASLEPPAPSVSLGPPAPFVSLAPPAPFVPLTPVAAPPERPPDPTPDLGDLMHEAEPSGWVLPEDPDDAVPWPDPPDLALDQPDPSLSSAGAFGGDPPEAGRRFGLGAFDPGRRGVKALAAVAVAVLAVAAYLAWHARPRVDTVAPPSFGATGAVIEPSGQGGARSVATELVVAVGGKVRKPGLVRLPAGARVADALDAAGGPEPGVDVAMLNLARKVVDGELIMVGVTPSPGVAVPAGPAGTGAAAAGGLVNLNTATLADLDTLPGVGPVLAQRILDAREAQGGFKAVSELRKVDGIGDARYEQLKDLVTV
jgi:competence protein ComEA